MTRKQFDLELARWAKQNGYTLRHWLWRKEDHYICSERTAAGKFRAVKCASESGARIEEIVI